MGKNVPGLIHTIILGDIIANKNYRNVNGVFVDKNIRDVSPQITSLFVARNVTYVSLLRDVVVEGNSWEMAGVRALLDDRDVYSGVIDHITTNDVIHFGAVPAIPIKRKLYEKLKTHVEIPYMSVPR